MLMQRFNSMSARLNQIDVVVELVLTGTAPVPFLYEINKKGDEVTVSDSTTTTIYKIKKLDKSNLVYSTSYDTIINATPFKLELEFTCVK
jgi:hypothetical protein